CGSPWTTTAPGGRTLFWTLVPRRPSHPQPRPAAPSWPRARLPCAPLPAVWRAGPRSPPESPSRYCPPCPRPPAVDRLGLTNNPRMKHCRARHLAACGHRVADDVAALLARLDELVLVLGQDT